MREELSLNQIDFADERFRISSPWRPLDALKESVSRVGILTPLRVQQMDASPRFRLISGFRRCAVAAEMRIDRVCAVVRPASASQKALFAEAIYESGVERSLSEVEKARVVSKLVRQFGCSRKEAIEEFLGFLGIRADAYQFKRLLQLADLPLNLQRACDGSLECDLALRLVDWPEGSASGFAELVESLQLGRNRQKEVFELLDDIAALGGAPPAQVWQEAAGRPLGAEGLTMQDFLKVRDRLLKTRFPTLSSYREKLQEIRSRLKIPPAIQIQMPENFEGSEIQIRLRVGSSADLESLSERLRELAEAEALQELFDLL